MSNREGSAPSDASLEEQADLLPIGPPAGESRRVVDRLVEGTSEGEPSLDLAGQADRRGYRMRRLLAFVDLLALCVAWVVTGALLNAVGRQTAGWEELVLFGGFLPVWWLFGSLVGLYHSADRRVDPSIADEVGKLLTVVTAWTWSYLIVRGAVTSGPNQILPAVALWGITIAMLVLFRPLARHFAHSRPWYWQNVIVIGHPDDSAGVVRRLRRHPEYGLRVVATPDIWNEVNSGRGIEQLLEMVRDQRASRVIVATAPYAIEARGLLVRGLREVGVQVDLVTGSADSFAPSVMLNYLEGLPVMSVPVMDRNKAARVMKRLFDLLGASAALVALSPLFAYCAVRIKLDSKGPVFFRQERVGKNDERFKVFKFRSMVADADQRKEEVEALNMHSKSDSGLMFKIPEDPRITRFGSWLRRWSIDELPQLINVVRGQMSLVGPRPLIPEEAERIGDHYRVRFKVLPGVTGAWQAHGRSDIGFEDMVQLDYMYVANWSFAQDLKLILRTIEVILHGRGAY